MLEKEKKDEKETKIEYYFDDITTKHPKIFIVPKTESEEDENKIEDSKQSVIGIFDPEKNNFNLNMWSKTDGEEIKKILKRINKLKLSKPSEDLLFQILFTNAYPPLKNLDTKKRKTPY